MRVIGMRANKEDWESVKDLVGNYENILNFYDYPYLLTGEYITNTHKGYLENSSIQIYETFDRAIFLEALDIKEEKIWKGIEMQFRYSNGHDWQNSSSSYEYRLRPIDLEVKQLQELAEKLGFRIEKL